MYSKSPKVLVSVLLSLLLLPSIASCAQNDSSTMWSESFKPMQNHFSISERFKQSQAKFDFNGDDAVDFIYYVDVVQSPETLSVVNLIQPWAKMDEQKEGAKTAVIIIHGGDLLPVIIHDKNDFSVLDTSAMVQSDVVLKDNIGLLDEPELNVKAKGDIIIIPTEAGIDSYIYWNGSKYQLFESIDIP